MKMKTNDQFSIELPDGWDDRTVHIFMGPDENGVQHMLSLLIDRETGGIDLSEYARERIDQITATMQSVEMLKDEERTLADGTPAYECVYKWVPPDGKPIFRKVVYLMCDGVGYTFTGTFSKKTMKTIGVEVEGMINSFRLAGADEDD